MAKPLSPTGVPFSVIINYFIRKTHGVKTKVYCFVRMNKQIGPIRLGALSMYKMALSKQNQLCDLLALTLLVVIVTSANRDVLNT